jgi:hypothetical protein
LHRMRVAQLGVLLQRAARTARPRRSVAVTLHLDPFDASDALALLASPAGRSQRASRHRERSRGALSISAVTRISVVSTPR